MKWLAILLTIIFVIAKLLKELIKIVGLRIEDLEADLKKDK